MDKCDACGDASTVYVCTTDGAQLCVSPECHVNLHGVNCGVRGDGSLAEKRPAEEDGAQGPTKKKKKSIAEEATANCSRRSKDEAHKDGKVGMVR